MELLTAVLNHDKALVGLCLAIVIFLYFRNNPLRHSRWFMVRRFINWFPLGMTYSFLYMGRYNLNVAKNALGEKQVVDLIAVMGYYQMVAMLLNVDRYPMPAGVAPELKPLP